ncbi:hypothetical protein PoB_004186700 [Plakobranchus ocellatus]|uniref:Uncharacterized protein n=1 Tax=Plakobranchus ocellatus TaxID=259542 RepID=A0AAV4B8D2_9GAST|nr:hypothetical protein PoB_004186700 [Plakobranchus ocellatus]
MREVSALVNNSCSTSPSRELAIKLFKQHVSSYWLKMKRGKTSSPSSSRYEDPDSDMESNNNNDDGSCCGDNNNRRPDPLLRSFGDFASIVPPQDDDTNILLNMYKLYAQNAMTHAVTLDALSGKKESLGRDLCRGET